MADNQTVVVGSGISGLTIALLQAMRGHKVTLVEQLPFIGGYINRFERNGLRFDIGFHFTGGADFLLPQILRRLGFDLSRFKASLLPSTVFLAESDRSFRIPNAGIDSVIDMLSDEFPDYAAAIRKYYRTEQEIVDGTPAVNLDYLADLNTFSLMTPYDIFTVNDFMTQLGIDNTALRTLLPIMASFLGTPPCEAPFSYHARCAYAMDRSISTVEGGGDYFLSEFKRRFAELGVAVRTGCTVKEMRFNENDRRCTGVLLSDGSDIPVDSVFFAIHPSAFIGLFPQKLLRPHTMKRIAAMRPTCGCFVMHGFFDEGFNPPTETSIYLQRNDLDATLLPGMKNLSSSIIVSNDASNRRPTFAILSNMFQEDCPPYHQEGYDDFKQRIREHSLKQIAEIHPEFIGKMHIVDISTPLTNRRFSPPLGTAYGTRQPIAQSRMSGQLPVKNCYNLGHHAQYPGILGCMLGAFSLSGTD
ncbi:MAG: NAD(P)/FAD-dependent oxidoreductase [Victivallales bacterium]|nr:NAD(P)/FAD-dependent oxidoreductase [Victivallales bacterium]